mmetsp:Transcript_7015/g.17671  ORF Transcript_7015/g.17671 Transcript_7015/m.17671 type:complete len:201 (-) Transcript_7015:353-955(-)
MKAINEEEWSDSSQASAPAEASGGDAAGGDAAGESPVLTRDEVMASAGVGWLNDGHGQDPFKFRGEEVGEAVRLFEFHHALGFLFIPVIVTYVLVLRCIFRSWTLNGATKNYKAGDSFEDRYRMAFDRRAELVSQLHWAHERGDPVAESTIKQQLDDLDEDIDELEAMVLTKGKDGKGGKALPKSDKLRQRVKAKGEEKI